MQRLGRAAILMTLVAAGTILLIRFAPGYFTDPREMDQKYAHTAESVLHEEQGQQASLGSIAGTTFRGWLHGDLGRSRQYDIPVSELVRPRLGVTLALLARALVSSWALAAGAALLVSLARGWTVLLGVPFTVLLAVPTAAIATLCLLAGAGGPVLVLTLLLAARNFRFICRVLRTALRAPHLLHARAQGIRLDRALRIHLLPNILPQLGALALLSLVTALSAIVPIEVIFDVPGVGQLAWAAAMNRDLPVLVAVTLLMASIVAGTGIFSSEQARSVVAT